MSAKPSDFRRCPIRERPSNPLVRQRLKHFLRVASGLPFGVDTGFLLTVVFFGDFPVFDLAHSTIVPPISLTFKQLGCADIPRRGIRVRRARRTRRSSDNSRVRCGLFCQMRTRRRVLCLPCTLSTRHRGAPRKARCNFSGAGSEAPRSRQSCILAPVPAAFTTDATVDSFWPRQRKHDDPAPF